MIYDYSSTVEKVVMALVEGSANLKVVIPESSVINGGYPYLKAMNEVKNIHFIPDAAMAYYMKSCDALLMGAETFFPDGTAFNTIGSDLAAMIAKRLNVPLYFVTPMNKLDDRSVNGFRKDLVMLDLKSKYEKKFNHHFEIDRVKFDCPELVNVDSNYINSFITELGIIPSNAMYSTYLEIMED